MLKRLLMMEVAHIQVVPTSPGRMDLLPTKSAGASLKSNPALALTPHTMKHTAVWMDPRLSTPSRARMIGVTAGT